MQFFDDIVPQPSKQHFVEQLRADLVPQYQQLHRSIQNQVQQIIDSLVDLKDKKAVQKFIRRGSLEQAPTLRVHLWKIMIDTLPVSHLEWESTKQRNANAYKNLLDKFFSSYKDEEDLLGFTQSNFDDQLWHSITLDTKRTHSAMNFFQSQPKLIKIYASSQTKHSDILSRILYIWGKTNPTVRYVQGMNEILAPLYYLEFQNEKAESESEVFFMFCSIITFLIDMHIKEMDNYEHGIMGRMNTLNKYLRVVDTQLWMRLEKEGVHPQYYSFRWLALLLAQEFGLYETIKLWDYMLSFEGYRRFFYLFCCCLAILKLRKDFLMKNDFIQALPRLQKLKDLDINEVIVVSFKIYEKYSRIDLQKLYQKIQCQDSKGIIKSLGNKQPPIKTEKGMDYAQILKSTSNSLAKWYSKQVENVKQYQLYKE